MESDVSRIRDEQRETWDTFSAGWKKWDDLVFSWLSPVGDELIANARLDDTSHLLDVAAGAGEPGLTAAARVPQGTVTVTDLSDRMLDIVVEKAAQRGIENVDVRQCDAGALPFSDDRFDAVTCRFGFMFFPDVDAALQEMVRVARPGARICSAVWSAPDENPWATTIMSAIAAYVDVPTPPPGAPGLFRCAAPDFMGRAYRQAGLGRVSEREVAGELAFTTPDAYWNFMTEIAAPVVAGLAKADAATRARIEQTVLDLARRTSATGEVRFRWSAVTIAGEVQAGQPDRRHATTHTSP